MGEETTAAPLTATRETQTASLENLAEPSVLANLENRQTNARTGLFFKLPRQET
jgi:hypothetical protein